MKTNRYFFIIIISVLLTFSLAWVSHAQSGCTGDPCVFYTPTPTPTGQPTPTPAAGTPTAVPMPTPKGFPKAIFSAPTPMTALSFPPVPSPYAPQLTPVPSPYVPQLTPVPSPITVSSVVTPAIISITLPALPNSISPTNISIPITNTVPISMATISTTIPLSYGTALTLNTTVSVTNSPYFTPAYDLVLSTQGLISDVVTYTNTITQDYMDIQGTETITVIQAPDDYAPTLPRPMADVGYTFEQLSPGVDTGQRFSIASWGAFLGYIGSLPFQFVKTLWALATYMGPFSLFLGWVLIMFGFVIVFNAIKFIWHLIITIIDLAYAVWELIPGN